MKRFLFIAVLITASFCSRAQSVTMNDLTNLTNLDNDEAHNYLAAGKKFKLTAEQTVNGLQVQDYRDTRVNSPQIEKVTVGMGVKGADGSLLRTVTYTTNQSGFIQNLMNQAYDAKMNITFRGNDKYKYIYIYNSFLYIVSIYVNRDQSSSVVKVQQKDLPSY